jgi:hypothetical protein
VEHGEDTASLHGVHPINEHSPLKPEPDELVSFSPRLTERTGACGIFGAEFVTADHPLVLLSQTPLVVFRAENIIL